MCTYKNRCCYCHLSCTRAPFAQPSRDPRKCPIFVYIFMCIHMYMHMCMYLLHVYMYMHISTCICIYINWCCECHPSCTCAPFAQPSRDPRECPICVYIFMCIHMYMYMYIPSTYVYVYAYIYMYMYIYKLVLLMSSELYLRTICSTIAWSMRTPNMCIYVREYHTCMYMYIPYTYLYTLNICICICI